MNVRIVFTFFLFLLFSFYFVISVEATISNQSNNNDYVIYNRFDIQLIDNFELHNMNTDNVSRIIERYDDDIYHIDNKINDLKEQFNMHKLLNSNKMVSYLVAIVGVALAASTIVLSIFLFFFQSFKSDHKEIKNEVDSKIIALNKQQQYVDNFIKSIPFWSSFPLETIGWSLKRINLNDEDSLKIVVNDMRIYTRAYNTLAKFIETIPEERKNIQDEAVIAAKMLSGRWCCLPSTIQRKLLNHPALTEEIKRTFWSNNNIPTHSRHRD